MKKSFIKQNKEIITIFGILLFAGILWYGGTHQWFKAEFQSILPLPYYPPELNNPDAQTSCSATISPSTITAGDTVTGTIQDGKNQFCEVFGIMEGTDSWRKIAEGTTSSSGGLVFISPFSVVGTFRFRAICGSCITNMATLTVNPAPTPDPCYDSDGKNKLTAGFTRIGSTDTAYDDCAGNWAVKEYYCNGNTRMEQVIACDAGYICYETRGGDYCKLIEEPAPESGGTNFNNMPCGSVRPSSAFMCAGSYCPYRQTCSYVKATLFSQAECRCV